MIEVFVIFHDIGVLMSIVQSFDEMGNTVYFPLIFGFGIVSKYEWERKKKEESSMPVVPVLEEKKNRIFNFSPVVIDGEGFMERGADSFSIWSNDQEFFEEIRPGYVFASFTLRRDQKSFSLSGFNILRRFSKQEFQEFRSSILENSGAFNFNMFSVLKSVLKSGSDEQVFSDKEDAGKIYHVL